MRRRNHRRRPVDPCEYCGALEAQGERTLAGEVRHFATTLPPVRTDRERLAAQLIGYLKAQRSAPTREEDWYAIAHSKGRGDASSKFVQAHAGERDS